MDIKPVLHFKVPQYTDGSPVFDGTIARSLAENIAKSLDEEYYVIVSPCDLQTYSADDLAFQVDGKVYTNEEIKEIIWKYEDLCK